MKLQTKLLRFLIVTAIAVTMGSCDQKEGSKTAVYLLLDNTEVTKSRIGLIDAGTIISTIKGKDSSGTGTLCIRSLNSVELNPTQRLCLNIKGGAMGDADAEVHRKVRKFSDTVKSVLATYLGESPGDAHSSLWQPFCQAIRELQEEETNKRVLVIASDMIEFSGNGNNFYTVVDSKDTVDAKIARLEMKDKLPEGCSNVKVVVVFNPNLSSDREKAQANFNRAMIVWKEIFKRHDIEYSVKTNF